MKTKGEPIEFEESADEFAKIRKFYRRLNKKKRRHETNKKQG